MSKSIKDLLVKTKGACQGFYYDDYDSPGGDLAVEIELLIEEWEKENTNE